MLSEGRKRDAAANAVLGLAFAANAAQSPKDLIRSGHIESPGVVQMQRTIGDPRKKPKDLNKEPVTRRGTKLKEGKTFREFVKEATIIAESRRGHFSTREELMKHHGGKLPDGTFIKNRGTKENPEYGLASSKAREEEKQRRNERIKKATGQLTPREKAKVATKRRLARERGAELHHGTEIETSAKEMRNMSPGDVLRHKKKQAQEKRYHGNDPKNLVIANKGPVSKFKPQQPGFHHGKFHAFERSNREKLNDISNAISPMRAFTTLVNKERRKTRRGED